MGRVRRSVPLLILATTFSMRAAAQTVMTDIRAADSTNSCTTDQPVLTDAHGKTIWLDTDSLLKSVRRCTAPDVRSLGRIARIEGQVSLDILVNDKGMVQCVRL